MQDDSKCGGSVMEKEGGCVYSDGPRSVYQKLNSGPFEFIPTPNKLRKQERRVLNCNFTLPSASLCRKQQLCNSLNSRSVRSKVTKPIDHSHRSDGKQLANSSPSSSSVNNDDSGPARTVIELSKFNQFRRYM
ncbi:hypothetical protein TSUD_224690 [Trifolium subterraneum]|uniref:Uncharacterized protein n=1 Tax=Trifolium subterraneum TaxID=3900 RepID=A0A2Z6NAJ0_TRISU|nr:hypothetical protein TSUD_224690 [Trifolium subterraneum]